MSLESLAFLIGAPSAVVAVGIIVSFARRAARRRGSLRIDVQVRWSDDVGRPQVFAPEGRISRVWAVALIELSNDGAEREIVRDVYLEVWGPRLIPKVLRRPLRRISRRVPGARRYTTAEPSRVDGQADWYTKANRTRVDWQVEPQAPTQQHHIEFERFDDDEHASADDPVVFWTYVALETGRGRRLRVAFDPLTSTR